MAYFTEAKAQQYRHVKFLCIFNLVDYRNEQKANDGDIECQLGNINPDKMGGSHRRVSQMAGLK